MELKDVFGNVIFALEGAKTIAEVVKSALEAKKSLRYANLRYANLSNAHLRNANLSYVDLSYANLSNANLRYANLSYAHLRNANLRHAHLSNANLSNANLSYVDLSYAHLRNANLSYVDLSYANLYNANLSYADLSYANLYNAHLSSANLSYANLSYAHLSSANLSYANLSSANLSYANNAELALARIQFIPETGAFEAWKKCKGGVIVRLLVPANAKRSHGAERKCRASHIKVLEVIGAEKGISLYDGKTEYIKGKTVKANRWDEDRWNICSNGIHFFLTRAEAEAFEY